MNRRQGIMLLVAVVAVLTVSLATGALSESRGESTEGVSSGVPTDENVTLADQPDPSSLNLSQIPWLEAYFQFYEPSNANSSTGASRDSGGSTSLLPIIVGTAVIVGVLGIVLLGWLWWLVRRTNSSIELAPTEQSNDGNPDTTDGTARASTDVEPTNDIYRAWQQMARHAGVPLESGYTPRELAQIAVERGMDRQAVETITVQFERVRYGGDPPTADRESRTGRALERLGVDRDS